MAVRRTFYIENNKVKEQDFNIEWNSGFAYSQKIKNINSLHRLISECFGIQLDKILEVSTKSPIELGKKLSSFNLFLTINGHSYNLESAYQSSKVFRTILGEKQHSDLINLSPMELKRKIQIEDHSNLVGFRFLDVEFPIKPKFLFYDWLYINAVNQIVGVYDVVSQYKYFTDIEFNPKKSLNCQARSLVLYIWLIKNKKLNDYLNEPLKYYMNIK